MTESVVDGLIAEVSKVVTEHNDSKNVHKEYLIAHKAMTTKQNDSMAKLKHLRYISQQVRKDIKATESRKDLTTEDKEKLVQAVQELDKVKNGITEMTCALPAEDKGLYLSIILGSGLDISLIDANSRYRYKQQYEKFKIIVTGIIVVMLLLCYIFPLRPLDAICNFTLVWYYCTLTIRESILSVNHSRIKGWWRAHHYISCVIAGITLTWPDGECYEESRNMLIGLTAYVAVLQLLQYHYQTGCLRRLHSLGHRDEMDITVEGFSSWMFKGLSFLIPLLLIGYFYQAYVGCQLFIMYRNKQKVPEWQVAALGCLFLGVAIGNLVTISIVVLRKMSKSSDLLRSYAVTKYGKAD